MQPRRAPGPSRTGRGKQKLLHGTATGLVGKKKGPGPYRAKSLILFSGAGERSRTPDLRITNALLYQLSYTGKEARL